MAKNSKVQQVTSAKRVAKLQNKGESKKSHKTYSKVRFYRPKTLKQARKPMYARTVKSSRPVKDGFDKYDVLQRPVATEKAMKKMEEENTMVFMCALSAKKTQIREAFKRLYNTKVRSVNTMVTPQGKKKAYIRLSADSDSLSLANKIGII